MAAIFQLLGAICGLVSFVCLIIVIVKMFQNGDSTLGIITAILCFCGIGALIAFVVGWMKVGVYNVHNVMMAWTGSIIGAIIMNILVAVTARG